MQKAKVKTGVTALQLAAQEGSLLCGLRASVVSLFPAVRREFRNDWNSTFAFRLLHFAF
jgi:hypothetical protein